MFIGIGHYGKKGFTHTACAPWAMGHGPCCALVLSALLPSIRWITDQRTIVALLPILPVTLGRRLGTSHAPRGRRLIYGDRPYREREGGKEQRYGNFIPFLFTHQEMDRVQFLVVIKIMRINEPERYESTRRVARPHFVMTSRCRGAFTHLNPAQTHDAYTRHSPPGTKYTISSIRLYRHNP